MKKKQAQTRNFIRILFNGHSHFQRHAKTSERERAGPEVVEKK